jgi:dipeptidyl aminopeptidase/acylaminoacyl peptidase
MRRIVRSLVVSLPLSFLVSLVAIARPGAQAAPPATDIYLAPLSMVRDRPVVGTPVNITHRPGYDNQPSFTPDGRAILFTSVRDDGQSDIYRYDVAAGTTTRVTSTPESEYSATVIPGGARFSVIRVERDSAQRLWSLAMDGSDPRLVLTALRPVGYHAWIDANNLALFVLGRPNALVHADARTGAADTLARNIGRSLLPLPDGRGFSYVRTVDSTSVLSTMRWPAKRSTDLIALPRGAQDVAWASSDVVLTTSGSTLLFWRVKAPVWKDASDFAAAGLTNLSRLAVSPDGKWLAIVAVPSR